MPASIIKLEEITTRYRFIIMAGLFLASLITHAFFILDGLGEQDAARLIIDAVKWHKTGILALDAVNYRAQTSPLYLIFLKGLIAHGISLRELPAYMNWLNWFIAGFVPLVVFAVTSRWVGGWIALVGTIFFALNPAVWTASHYGFPSLPGLLFFWTSLLFFHLVLEQKSGIRKLVPALGCLASSFLCLGLKLDLILGYPALLGILAFQNRSWLFWNYPKTDLALAILIPGFAVLGVMGLSSYIAASPQSPPNFLEGWSGNFPWTLSMLTKRTFFLVPGSTFGPVMAMLVVVAVIHFFFQRHRRRLLFLILSFSLPITVFWAFRSGDSARHWLLPASGLIFLPAAWLTDRASSLRRFLLIAVFISLANYFLMPPRANRFIPSSRLIASHQLIQKEVRECHLESKALFEIDAPKRCVVAYWRKPYVIYELLAGARAFNLIRAGSLLPEDPARHIWKVAGPDGKIFYVNEYYSEPENFTVPTRSDWVYWNPKLGLLQPRN